MYALKQGCYSLQLTVMLIIDDQLSLSNVNAYRPLLFTEHGTYSAYHPTQHQRFSVGEMVYLTSQQFQAYRSGNSETTWRPALCYNLTNIRLDGACRGREAIDEGGDINIPYEPP
jgi:hypothetical protein